MRGVGLQVVALSAALLAPLPAGAAAELVLLDGRTLRGESVELMDDQLVLRTEAGDFVPIPVRLVRELRIIEGEETPPTGLRVAAPRVLVGPPGGVRPVAPSEALAAFRRGPAEFRRSPRDPIWEPVSAYSWETDVTEFSPARWARSILDPTWRPKSAFKRDVTEFNPARWARPVFRAEWYPQGGWSPRGWFETGVSPPR